MVYVPTGSEAKEYKPASVVDWDWLTPVSSFSAVTVAPGTTAPVASLTEPVIIDVPVCANVAEDAHRTKVNTNTKNFDMEMSSWGVWLLYLYPKSRLIELGNFGVCD